MYVIIIKIICRKWDVGLVPSAAWRLLCEPIGHRGRERGRTGVARASLYGCMLCHRCGLPVAVTRARVRAQGPPLKRRCMLVAFGARGGMRQTALPVPQPLRRLCSVRSALPR